MRNIRSQHQVPAYRPGKMAERGELTLEDVTAGRNLLISKAPFENSPDASGVASFRTSRIRKLAAPRFLEAQIVALNGANPAWRGREHAIRIKKS